MAFTLPINDEDVPLDKIYLHSAYDICRRE